MKKAVSGIMLTLLILTNMLTLAFNIQPVKAESTIWTVDDDGPADFHTIQEAINAANPGDTVFVRAGTYYENIVVDKSLTLIGEGSYFTFICGGEAQPGPLEVAVINITADDVSLSGFTIKCGEIGIAIHSSLNVTVHNNRIIENLFGINVVFSNDQKIISNMFLSNTFLGISVSNSTGITVTNNTLRDNGNGIFIGFSNQTLIYRNSFINNTSNSIITHHMTNSALIKNNIRGLMFNRFPSSNNGITLVNSSNNNIQENTIWRTLYGIYFQNSSNNIIYHNNFLAEYKQTADAAKDWPNVQPSINIWDNGYPSGGNFWIDYTGVDEFSGPEQNQPGSDGLGDTPYIIDEDNIDRYPLISPWNLWLWTETIYIRADGSVQPETAPFSTTDNVTYTLTSDILVPEYPLDAVAIVVERDNIILDGADCTVWAPTEIVELMGRYQTIFAADIGIALSGRNSVTIRNININGFKRGIWLNNSSNNLVTGNSVTENRIGITLDSFSNFNSISENNIALNDQYGIYIRYSSQNTILKNTITTNNKHRQYESYLGGLYLERSFNNSISENNIIANFPNGIYLFYASNNTISRNKMINNGLMLYYGTSNSILINDFVDAGILLSFSSENRVSQNNLNGIWLEWGCNYNELLENNITNSIYGIYLEKSDYNRISGNRITNCSSIGIYVTRSSDNIISNNNFINNAKHAYSSGSTNIWDDGYPSGGNYWSDYAGVDFYRGPYQNETGSDGLGDTSYVIDVNNRDNYPLMAPLNTFEAQHWDGITYNFHVISNSTILNFELFESLIPEIPSTISLNVSGPDNTRGFCRITIPNIIVQDLWKGSYIVLLNGQPWPFSNWTDTTNTYVYINYTHSTHEIIIIPEFPSITTIFMVATLTLTATIILKAKRKRQSPKFFPI